MIGPPTNSASVNCQPISSARMMPSSITRFVDANSNAMAAVKLAPLRNRDRASATAAYEHEEEASAEATCDHDRPRGIVREQARHLRLRDHGLHGGRQPEAQDQRPQDLPAHPPEPANRAHAPQDAAAAWSPLLPCRCSPNRPHEGEATPSARSRSNSCWST